jgi:large subunit ribosomal protein L30
MSAQQGKREAVLTVRQVKSGIGFDRTQKATLRALGLGRIGKSRRHPDNPQIRGMIATVPHLVVVESASDEGVR